MKGGWDVIAAELVDTRQAVRLANRKKRRCIYCGRWTQAVSGVCLDHDDLPAMEVEAMIEDLEREQDKANQ